MKAEWTNMKVEWANKDNLSVETTGQNNKAILVIDMPENCASGCPIMCLTRGINHRPTWCPLKPLPQKSGLVHQDADGWCKLSEYSRGWNACIEEIEK